MTGEKTFVAKVWRWEGVQCVQKLDNQHDQSRMDEGKERWRLLHSFNQYECINNQVCGWPYVKPQGTQRGIRCVLYHQGTTIIPGRKQMLRILVYN